MDLNQALAVTFDHTNGHPRENLGDPDLQFQ
jgi:hypothetical protein